MADVIKFPEPAMTPKRLGAPLVIRDIEAPKVITVWFDRPLSEEEYRFMRDVILRAVEVFPAPSEDR